MNEEKQALMGNSTPPPAPPPAYTPAPTQYPPPPQAQAGYPTAPQYAGPTQFSGYPTAPQYAGPTQFSGYPPQPQQQQQQQHTVAVITGVPVQQREVWYSARGGILPQPDPNRVVIGGTARFRYGMLTSTSYTYADQLPCLTSTMVMFIFLCFFLGTPLSLLCSIPAYIYINKANEEANVRNDIPAARDSYRVYKISVWGLSFWFGIVLGLGITLGILGGVGVL